MIPRRIYVIWSNPIFHDSLRALLKHPEIKWLGSAMDIEGAVEEITRLEPDFIVVEVGEKNSLGDLIHGIEPCNRDLHILSLNMDTNQATLYHREERLVVEEADLLQIMLDPANIGGFHENTQ